MGTLLDLTKDLHLSDCKICEEPSKRAVGISMDLAGPGIPSVIYNCNNRKCKNKTYRTAVYLLSLNN